MKRRNKPSCSRRSNARNLAENFNELSVADAENGENEDESGSEEEGSAASISFPVAMWDLNHCDYIISLSNQAI